MCLKERKVKVKSASRVRLFATPWTVAYQAPLSMGFSRQEYWSGVPLPSPGDLPDPGMEPRSPALHADALPSEPPGTSDVSSQLQFCHLFPAIERMGFPCASEGKASLCNAGDPGSIPGLGRSPGEASGTPLQYSCLENPMDCGA